jgi:hypothetical protein
MQFRRSLAFLNIALFGAAIVAEFLLPRYSTYIFYGLIIWMVGSLFLFYGPAGSRSASLPRPRPAAAGTAGGAPLPSGVGSAPTSRLSFCVYCGTDLPQDAAQCVACGKPVQAI